MCGIVGLIAHSDVNLALYDALTIIQHRGQDAAGIMTCDHGRMKLRKANGLVRDAIRERHMHRLIGPMGLGHVRYPTAGSTSPAESQPFYVNSPYGIGLVHNGNLTNSHELANELRHSDLRHLNTESDSEVLLNVLAYELHRVADQTLTPTALQRALRAVYRRVEGAYSVIAMINGAGLLFFRDPYGIRPLIYGRRESSAGVDYMAASESVALTALGFDVIDDVQPGQAIFIDLNHRVHTFQCGPEGQDISHTPCIFEYIYLARPDSIIDGISVYQARVAMGRALAEKIKREQAQHPPIDVVIPIPDTSQIAAYAAAQSLGLHYCGAFIKNRYIGRTFIMSGQTVRRNSVRLKLSPIEAEFKGKTVLLIDDSIVRGTTSRKIIEMARDAGAARVYFASAAPPLKYPNVYGIDMPTTGELIAHNYTDEEVANQIGADWLIYQDLEALYEAVNSAVERPEQRVTRFEDSVFTGHYIAGHVDQGYLEDLAKRRNT